MEHLEVWLDQGSLACPCQVCANFAHFARSWHRASPSLVAQLGMLLPGFSQLVFEVGLLKTKNRHRVRFKCPLLGI